MRISFRYKIQGAVLLILSLVLGIYIWLASISLQREKLAGLYENALSHSELVATRISRLMSSNSLWLESAVGSGATPEQLEPVFKKAKDLKGVWTRIGGVTNKIFDTRSLPSSDPLLPAEIPVGVTVKPGSEKQTFWLGKKGDNATTPEVLSLWSTDLFEDEADRYPDASMVLGDPTAHAGLLLNSPDSPSGEILNDMLNVHLSQGAEVQETKMQGRDYILASNPVEALPLIVYLAYPRELALKPVKDLQRRSIYFAGFVIGVAALLALYMGNALTRQLSILTEDTEQIASGHLDVVSRIKSNDEIGTLSDSVAKMAASLKQYIVDVAEKSRMESELKTARTVQETLFPEPSWAKGDYSLNGYYESASECGGDFWFYWCSDKHLYFMIGDATGHGVPAALITSAARSAFATIQVLGEENLSKIVFYVDHAIRESSKGSILMTAFFGRLELETGNVEFVNCSHEPGLIIKPGEDKPGVMLEPLSPRLGDRSQNAEFKTGSFSIGHGESFCLYTDGFTEIATAEGRQFGERKFYKLVCQSLPLAGSPREFLDATAKAVKDFSKLPPHDDLTMIIVSRT